jgi:hypothetical protein
MLYHKTGPKLIHHQRSFVALIICIGVTTILTNFFLIRPKIIGVKLQDKEPFLNIVEKSISLGITLDDFVEKRSDSEKRFFSFIRSTRIPVVITEGSAYHLWRNESLPVNTDFDLFSFETKKLCSTVKGDFREPDEFNGFECAIDFMSVHPLRDDELNILNRLGLCQCEDMLCPCDLRKYLFWRYGPSMECSFISAKSFLGYRESEFDLEKLRDIREFTYKHFAKPFIEEMSFHRPECIKGKPELNSFIDCIISWLHGEIERSECFKPFNFTMY